MASLCSQCLATVRAMTIWDLGCVAAHGYFRFDKESAAYETHSGGKPATAFLLSLISQLQFSGTVPMIDVHAYAQWLSN